MFRKVARKTLDGIGKYKLYFLRGYQGYIALVMSVGASITIYYRFIIEKLDNLPSWMSFGSFIIVFGIVLVISATLLGMFDYIKGTFRKEQEEFAKQSPIWRKLFRSQDRIEENQKRIEAKLDELLEERK